jgi:hypothetical protein
VLLIDGMILSRFSGSACVATSRCRSSDYPGAHERNAHGRIRPRRLLYADVYLTCVAADDGVVVRADALAPLVSSARTYVSPPRLNAIR